MRRPWNIIDSPVYSLATYHKEKVNMNICTYVMPISMKPKQYAMGIYYDTKTMDLLNQSNTSCVLQLLNSSNIELVKPLGKKSGHRIDKKALLVKKNKLSSWNELPVIAGANAYLLLEKVDRLSTGGDHELFIFQVLKSKTLKEDNVLMFQELIEKGVIL